MYCTIKKEFKNIITSQINAEKEKINQLNQLYLDEDANICLESCSDATNNKIYIYQNKCVLECPESYFPDLNNLCIIQEEQSDYLTNIDSTDEILTKNAIANGDTLILDNNC